MRTVFGIIIILALALGGVSMAKNPFVIQEVGGDSESGAVSINVKGEGVPEFTTYSLKDPSRVVVRFSNGRLPDIPVKLSYSYPVKRLELQRDVDGGRCVNLVCEIEGLTSYTSDTAENGMNLMVNTSGIVRNTSAEMETPDSGWLDKKISVDFENTPLGSALSLLARQNGFDVVTSGLEDFDVTARLVDVKVRDALDALLGVSGLSYFVIGEIVVVKSKAGDSPGEMVTRVFKLKYIDARQIETQVTNMLTSRGKMQVISDGQKLGEGSSANYPAGAVAVTDVASVMPLIEEFVSRVDMKPRQVAIGVKLIETTINDNESFGIDWETSLTGKITGAEGDNVGNDPTNERLSAVSTLPLKSGSFTYGTLTLSEVSSMLEFLKTAGESRLLSSPSVTTSNGKPAVIDVVTTIPIQTVNRFSEGAVIQDIVTFQYKDVGITLSVTPIINEDGYITLKCMPTVEEITGWVGPSENQQPITSKRSVNTDVIVKSGETLVIGGLMKESEIENISGIWLLSDIPVLGELFKHRSKQKAKTDLMILITPTILP